MPWDSLTDDAKRAALRAQGRPTADVENVGAFGVRYDEAEAEGRPLDLSAGEVLAARRLGLGASEYAALKGCRTVTDWEKVQRRQRLEAEAAEEAARQAAVARAKAAL